MNKILRFEEYNESKKVKETEKAEEPKEKEPKKSEEPKVSDKPKKSEEDDKICICFKVKSKAGYKVTDVALNSKAEVERAIKTKHIPGGDGCDYKLTDDEIQQLKDGKFDDFKPSKDAKR